jgi:hypothetical protein
MRSLSWVGRGGQSASGCGWLFGHYRFDRLGPIESLICTDAGSAGGHGHGVVGGCNNAAC